MAMDIRVILQAEFECFTPPDGFTGGRYRSKMTCGDESYYVHLRADGSIGKIEVINGNDVYYLKPISA